MRRKTVIVAAIAVCVSILSVPAGADPHRTPFLAVDINGSGSSSDTNNPPGPLQTAAPAGWTDWPTWQGWSFTRTSATLATNTFNKTFGSVSVTITTINNAGTLPASRDRGDPNGGNDEYLSNMYRDFIYVPATATGVWGQDYLQLDFSGLDPNKAYEFTVFDYDASYGSVEGESGTKYMAWGIECPCNYPTYEPTVGGGGLAPKLARIHIYGEDDPCDVNLLDAFYYSGSFAVQADGNGQATIYGWCDNETSSFSRHAFLNGFAIGLEPNACNPNPSDGETDVGFTPNLTWSPGFWAQAINGHEVYFGTDFNDVNDANTSTAGIYLGATTDPNYQITTTLDDSTDYYWRVDEVNDANADSPWKGDVWHFVTTNTEPVNPSYSTGTVYYNIRLQQLEGFGAAACYDVTSLTGHSQKETLYDLFFRDLGIDVLRIKNTYESDSSSLTATAEIVSAARESGRNPNLKTELVPWSPPASLKSNGSINSGTLKKDANDANNSAPYYYVYNAYANWWLNSLTEPNGWAGAGIYPDYISIQNEPDWEASYDACKLLTTETASYAGYDKAFEAVYNKLDGNVSPMPKIIAPESMGFGNSQAYITALNNRGQLDNIYGFSFHLYSDGDYNNPDGYLTGMENYAVSYGYKPLFMTEFIANGTPTLEHAINMAWHIHNCLYYLGATSYYHWSMFRGSYTTGGVINLNSSSTYIIRDLYWFLKAYAYYTDPNWYLVDCTTNPSDNLRMSAFNNPDYNELTVVILNKSSTPEYLTLSIDGFSPDLNTSAIYQSTESENWLSLGAFDPCEELALPAESITTIHMSGERQFTVATGNAAKCTIKAGKIQGQDSFSASGTFTGFSPSIGDSGTFDVNIVSSDGNEIYSESNDFTVSDPVKNSLKYTHRIRGSQGAISSLKFDFNKNTFSINASKVDLTGLACPLVLNITINRNSLLSTEFNEVLVNGKKPVPTRLMKTYGDKLVVTKATAKHSTKPLSDSLSVTGEIAVEDIDNTDMNEPNLAARDVNFVWGDQVFTVLAGDFVSAKTGHKYTCKKVQSDANEGLVTAKFDLDKCTFTISVKEVNNINTLPDYNDVNFSMNYGIGDANDFNETADVNLVTRRSY